MTDEIKETAPDEDSPQSDEAVTLDGEAQVPPLAKPALKLAQAEVPVADDTTADGDQLIGEQEDVPADEPTVAEVAAPASSAMLARKQMPPKFGLMTVNRFLTVAVLVIVCLAGFEVWSNARTIQMPDVPPAIFMPDEDDSDLSLPPLEALIKSFEARPILGNPKEAGQDDGGDERPPPILLAGAIKYARENLNLIGMSDGEAIVMDKKAGKMFFLRVGGEIPINDQRLRVEQIGADLVQFTDGKETVTVK